MDLKKKLEELEVRRADLHTKKMHVIDEEKKLDAEMKALFSNLGYGEQEIFGLCGFGLKVHERLAGGQSQIIKP